MPNQLQQVQPGDLITADLLNAMITIVNTLDQRVVVLEMEGPPDGGVVPGGAPVVTSVTPLTPRISDTVTIKGRNFGSPALNTVTINGTLLTKNSGSNDSTIVFTVPNLTDVTSTGMRGIIVINTSAGPTQTEVMVFPFVPTKPEGEVTVSLQQPPSEKLVAGDHEFTYRVRGVVNMDEVYDVAISTDTSGWSAVVLSASGQVVTSPTVSLKKSEAPGDTADIRVRVTIPASPAGGTAHLTVRATAQRNAQLVGGNGSGDLLTRDASSPPAQTDITIACTEVRSSSDAQPPFDTKLVTGPITITPTNSYWRLTFRAHFASQGNYTATLLPISDGKWSQRFTISSDVTTQPVGVPANDSDQTVQVFVKAASGANPVDVTLKIQKDDAPAKVGQYAQRVQL